MCKIRFSWSSEVGQCCLNDFLIAVILTFLVGDSSASVYFWPFETCGKGGLEMKNVHKVGKAYCIMTLSNFGHDLKAFVLKLNSQFS